MQKIIGLRKHAKKDDSYKVTIQLVVSARANDGTIFAGNEGGYVEYYNVRIKNYKKFIDYIFSRYPNKYKDDKYPMFQLGESFALIQVEKGMELDYYISNNIDFICRVFKDQFGLEYNPLFDKKDKIAKKRG